MEHEVWITPDQYVEAYAWCVENFGKINERVTWNGLANNDIGGSFLFEDAEDALAFKLVWN